MFLSTLLIRVLVPSAELFSLCLPFPLADCMSFFFGLLLLSFFSPRKDERETESFDRFIACKSMKGATKNLRLNG